MNNNEEKIQGVVNTNPVNVENVEVLGATTVSQTTNQVPVQPVVNQSSVQPVVQVPTQPVVNQVPVTPSIQNTPVQPSVQPVVQSSVSPEQNNVLPSNEQSSSISVVNPMAKAQEQLINRMKQNQEVVPMMEEVIVDGSIQSTSNLKYVLTIILFILLLAMIIFLPNISEAVTTLMNPVAEEEIITTGSLSCSINETTDIYTLEYTNIFEFTDSKLKSLNFTSLTKGDKNIDKLELEQLNKDCKLLDEMIEEYDGIDIICSLNDGVNSVEQNFNYVNIDSELLSAAYVEMGGIYPQYRLDQEIDDVEQSMIASGYECKRSK